MFPPFCFSCPASAQGHTHAHTPPLGLEGFALWHIKRPLESLSIIDSDCSVMMSLLNIFKITLGDAKLIQNSEHPVQKKNMKKN